MSSTFSCDVSEVELKGPSMDSVAMKYAKSYDKRWGRLTVWKSGTIWAEGENIYDRIPKSKSERWGHYKKVVRGGTKWQLEKIPTREFDTLKVAKMREICEYYSIEIALSKPCKEEILNILDDYPKEVKDYLQLERLSRHMGDFCYYWKNDKTLMLSKDLFSPKREINVTKKGIIESLLEDVDRLSFVHTKATETIKALSSDVKTLEITNADLISLVETSQKEKQDLITKVKELESTVDKLSTSFAESEKNNDLLREDLSRVSQNSEKVSRTAQSDDLEMY